MSAPPRFFLVAAEPSGDALGAGLIDKLRERVPDAEFCGVGGRRMAARGVVSPFDIRELSVLGLLEGLAAYPRVVKRAEETAACADAAAPDIAVLIDSWGFTLRVAQRLKKRRPELPVVKYAGPQVWATRPGRAKTLAACVDEVLVLQPFEPPYFERAGLAATFVGHPALEQTFDGDGAAFRARYKIPAAAKVALVLFGSRGSEVRRLAEPFADAMARLKARHGDDLVLVAPLAESVATDVRARAADDARLHEAILIDEPERDDAFAAADVALSCSGTVVTELAMAGVPTVAAYKLGLVTWAIAKVIYTAPHISLVNMAAGERIVPECVQFDATGERLAAAVDAFLDNPELARSTRAKLAAAIAKMKGDGASPSAKAADAVMRVLAAARPPAA